MVHKNIGNQVTEFTLLIQVRMFRSLGKWTLEMWVQAQQVIMKVVQLRQHMKKDDSYIHGRLYEQGASRRPRKMLLQKDLKSHATKDNGFVLLNLTSGQGFLVGFFDLLGYCIMANKLIQFLKQYTIYQEFCAMLIGSNGKSSLHKQRGGR